MSLRDFLRSGDHFTLPDSLVLLAYFTFGLTGALAGLKRGYDFVGVVSLALITAGGGGLIRDGVFISRGPSALLTDWRFLAAVLVAALSTLLFHRYLGRMGRAIAVIDALGLGAFAVYGVEVSIQADLSVPGAILGGTVTVVGGGLLRDILVGEEPLLFMPGQFYVLVVVGGCGLFMLLVRLGAMTPNPAALVTIAVTFMVRMLAIRFNWRTTAIYRKPPDTSE
jgi:uncharacterized membrane protein YeiH